MFPHRHSPRNAGTGRKNSAVRSGHGAVRDYLPSYADLRDLLTRSGGARAYYLSLPPRVQAALWRQERIASGAELQSFAADEGEARLV